MAKTPVNSALLQIRGAVDGWVYRHVEGETVIAKPVRERKPPNQNQLDAQEEFRRSIQYATQVFADPVRKAEAVALAVARGTSPARVFGFVVRDFARPPVITGVDVTQYLRRAGDVIDVFATDEGKVTEVTVTLKRADGTVIEADSAALYNAGWRYTALTTPPAGPITIEVMAMDIPGNRTIRTEVVP